MCFHLPFFLLNSTLCRSYYQGGDGARFTQAIVGGGFGSWVAARQMWHGWKNHRPGLLFCVCFASFFFYFHLSFHQRDGGGGMTMWQGEGRMNRGWDYAGGIVSGEVREIGVL